MSAGETADQMKRRRPVVAAESADAAIRRDERKAALRREQMIDADDPTKMGKVRATAHADMLAGVDELPGRGVLKRAGPAAQTIASFEERDGETARRQGSRRRQARQAAAEDEHTALWHQLILRRRDSPANDQTLEPTTSLRSPARQFARGKRRSNALPMPSNGRWDRASPCKRCR